MLRDCPKYIRTVIIVLLLPVILSAQFYKNIFNKVEFRPEFREPFYITWYELKGGVSVWGGKGLNPWDFRSSTIGFDSTETSMEDADNIIYRVMQYYRLDFLEFNWLQLLIPQNYVDFQTGLGITLASNYARLSLPDAWPQKHPVDKKRLKFTPRLYRIQLNNTLLFPVTPATFISVEYSYGYNYATLLRSVAGEGYLQGSAPFQGFSVGFKYLGVAEGTARLVLGVEYHSGVTRLDKIKDPENISPIEKLRFQNKTLTFTIGGIFGGTATSADRAKQKIEKGDYLGAKDDLIAYKTLFPRSLKNRKADKLINLCDELIPWQRYQLADSLIKTGNYSRALKNLNQAAFSSDTSLQSLILAARDSMVLRLTEEADSLTEAGDIESAFARLNLAYLSHSRLRGRVDQSLGLIHFRRGQALFEFGLWEKAMAELEEAKKLNPYLKDDVLDFEMKIAVGYLKDVNKAVDEKNVFLALESLKAAQSIRTELEFITGEYIRNLEEGIRYLKEQEGARMLSQSLAKMRSVPAYTREKITPGMTLPDVEARYGQPVFKTHLQDKLNQRFDLYVYKTENKQELYLYFKDFTLVKIEEK